MIVFVLFITILSVVPGEIAVHGHAHAVAAFQTLPECQSVLADVQKDMIVAYPGAHDYLLTCEQRHRQAPTPSLYESERLS